MLTGRVKQIQLPAGLAAAELWPLVARLSGDWLREQGVQARDAVLLLPFADLLPWARQAYAQHGGWQPRVETAATLAATLGPAPEARAGAPTGDAAIDRLLAAAMLGSLPAAREWRRRDPAAFQQALDDLIQAAHLLRQAATSRAPRLRGAWWAEVQRAIDGDASRPPLLAPGLTGDLTRLAVAWAALSDEAATDRLFALRPSAWLYLQAGGEDALVASVLAEAAAHGRPVLVLCADGPADQALEAVAGQQPRLWHAADAEQEALAAAAAVLEALEQGLHPVALVAEDRRLLRRIRALLERQPVVLADESGWILSTTRPAAHLMAVLRATRPGASADAHLDALKADAAPADSRWIDPLELHWRGLRPTGQADERLQQALDRWRLTQARWSAFGAIGARSLAGWLDALRGLLLDAPSAGRWRAEATARSVWQALRLDSASAREDVDALTLDLDEFIAWVDAALSSGQHIEAVDREGAQVIITPLARAILRPFAAVILAGADERTLGAAPPAPALLGDALLRAIGCPDRADRARRAAWGFAHLLRQPGVQLLRRLAEGDEHLGPSPWILQLQLARHRRGWPRLMEAPVSLPQRELQPRGVAPPRPSAAGALPASLSASGLEALRTCPYRFFARSVLRLGETDELDADPGKRDFGTLLHAVLQRFHDQRAAPGLVADETRQLLQLADEVATEAGLAGPAMLPFRAGLPAFAQRYLAWLGRRDAEGWTYSAGELEREAEPAALAGPPALKLKGRIDRLDRLRGGTWQVIDYKTGAVGMLKDKLKQPFEDTQLAFYAAQLREADPGHADLRASYLALDEREGIVELAHPDVSASADALLGGLAGEWQRLAQGEPLLALGEGAACEFCEARGLCRRDHWAAPVDEDTA